MKEGISGARRHLVRDALVYTPILIVALVLWGTALQGAVAAVGGGRIFLLLLLTIVVFLVGFQSMQSLRDLRSQPVTSQGAVMRKWRRAEFFLFPAYYVYVNRTVFKVPQLFYENLDRGDIVEIVHFPHTAMVVGVNRIRRGIDTGG